MRSLADLAKAWSSSACWRSARRLADFLARQPPPRQPKPIPLWRRAALRLFALTMPLHHWVVSAPALRYYYQLRRTEWLAPEQVRALQEQRLRALITHAYRHVPYYREGLDRLGIEPESIAAWRISATDGDDQGRNGANGTSTALRPLRRHPACCVNTSARPASR